MRRTTAILATLLLTTVATAQQLPSDIPRDFAANTAGFDYVRRAVDIPMRDGVKLHAVILMKKGAKEAPILLDRTPYNAEGFISDDGPKAAGTSRQFGSYVENGYIAVVEDVRGKYGSGGVYVNERPLRGPLNPTKVDHATDAWDTIDWLVKNLPETNGRVGMIGTSYDGMMVAMALTDPHPALKAAVPSNPVINTYLGDDDFHGGAWRMIGYDYYFGQDGAKGNAGDLWREAYDDYDVFLRAGSAGDFARSRGVDKLPVVQRFHAHPAYDDFWMAQALEDILPRRTPSVPTLWVAGQWDQEDIYGAIAAWRKLYPVDPTGLNHLVIGPWSHGGWGGDGSSLGAIRFDSDTGLYFREKVLRPFLDGLLKTGATPTTLPPVLAFQTGTNQWQRLSAWPLACAGTTCGAAMERFYFRDGAALGRTAPATQRADSYVSDPAKPVPYRLRPIRPTYAGGTTWKQWLVDDQRPFSDRTDVLSYRTEPLDKPVAISGAAIVDLLASTTGTDGDFVVKLIDVYPDLYPAKPEMAGYQLGIAMDILRGRYRESLSAPKPIPAGVVQGYKVQLPHANHVFLPGHRIMVQVQSSWFPLYDRNPQTYVPSIFDAKPGDYRKATVSVMHGGAQASYIELPVVPVAAE